MSAPYTIGHLAKAAEVNVETIRYYQRRGLLTEPERMVSSIRRYSDTDLDRLRFIRHAQSAGFTLDEIAGLLQLRSQVCCAKTRTLAAAKLEVIDQRLNELAQLRADLTKWVGECDANPTNERCPVIEHLEARL